MIRLSNALRTAPFALALGLAACGGSDEEAALPQLSAATGATLRSCAGLAGSFSFANTTISAATDVAAGTLTVAGQPVPAHCRVTGSMYPRTSSVDGQTYAIAFEMRLPVNWNGRYFYQANGGTDGAVGTATGGVGGGGPLTNALAQGFAVISSDAGHNGAQNPTFGIDPQARQDYGYQAVGKLTPMAKGLIQAAYGKGPDRSYLGGCSNGGRHAMVAIERYGDQYDGILVGDPGTVLPRAAIANMAGAQAYSALATTTDISTGFTQPERALVSKAVLAKCDALDGATDGLVQATESCQAAFNLDRDVPTCTGARDGTCLSAAQKTAIAPLFAGVKTSSGTLIYSSFPYDAGLATNGWASWKFVNSISTARDPGAIAFIWQVPPADPTGFDGRSFALGSNIDKLYAAIQATSTVYVENALSFMTPPHIEQADTVRNRGGKVMIYHGTSDPIFSSDHSVSVWKTWNATYAGKAADFARLYLVPGMNHCSGGPSTDQFDMLTPLVNWVEKGQAPDSVVAAARGTGNPGGVNTDVPATWSPTRTRPLCTYPQVARLKAGATDLESASSFSCQ
ncbi:tannase/feruloyl esterase family alpha/beta hydrolase [Aquabacterium sp.]|uniref:tannase/feruloyl esterase family alpha/beta hydrolase n=1 Tax=Aquabacterium sp. TaxID=1872578 RepID=UPI003782DABF